LEIVEREDSTNAESLAKAAKIYYDLQDRKRAQILIDKALHVNPNNVLAHSVVSLLLKPEEH
jgi:Tfp pilus assembly protein PilF